MWKYGLTKLSCLLTYLSYTRDLEKAVEDLTELLETPIEADDIPSLRQKMTDKTVKAHFLPRIYQSNALLLQVYVQKRNEILLDDTSKGYQDDRWRWNVTVDGFGPASISAD